MKILGPKPPSEEGGGEYVELESGQDSLRKIPIQVEKISEYADSDRIQRKVRDGAILLVRVKELRDKNIGELKRAIERIRRTTDAIGGEIVGAGEDWIIISPSIAKIVRTSE